MAGKIEEGVIIRIEQIRSEMFICEEAKPPDDALIKPFPPTCKQSSWIQQHDGGDSNNRIVDEDSRKVASDVSKYLANDQNTKSDVLK